MKQSVGKALGFSDSWGPENSVYHLEQQGTSIIVIIDAMSGKKFSYSATYFSQVISLYTL